MSTGSMTIFVPSGILINPVVWSQLTWAEIWGYALFEGGARSPSNTMWPGPRPTSILSGILSIQPFGHNRHGPKSGGSCAPFLVGDDGSPSKTMWPGPRSTCMPSFILIHPTVWSQYINVTDTERQRTHFTNGHPTIELFVPQRRAQSESPPY